MDGLEQYLSPNWEAVANPGVWRAAFGQIFFTLSLGFGIMIAYASYLPSDSDVSNNSFMTAFANCATSFYAGFAVFSVLGGLAWILNMDVTQVVEGGPGLVFKVYPVALSELPGGSFWGMLFFLSLLMLGIDSAFSIVEAVVTGLNDIFPEIPRQVIVSVLCIFGLIMSVMVFCKRSGMMWLSIADTFISSNFGLPLVGMLECVAVGMFFNTDRFREKINAQSEIRVGRWWNVFVQLLIPAVLGFLLWDAVIQYAEPTMGSFHKISEHSVLLAGWGYFGLILFFAFLFGGNYTGVAWISSGIVLSLLMWPIPGMTWGMIIMTTIGLLLLFGGFFTCLLYVRTDESKPEKSGSPGPSPSAPEESHGEADRVEDQEIPGERKGEDPAKPEENSSSGTVE